MGWYSWVPDDVQKQILKICGENLDASGIAYVSYNTLPGWNAVKTVRDMMLYHGQNFDNPKDRVREARNMLQFAHDNISKETGPYKLSLDSEIKVLATADDNYLLHDHLEAHNEPCYFHEFMDKAHENGLGYLGRQRHCLHVYRQSKRRSCRKINGDFRHYSTRTVCRFFNKSPISFNIVGSWKC